MWRQLFPYAFLFHICRSKTTKTTILSFLRSNCCVSRKRRDSSAYFLFDDFLFYFPRTFGRTVDITKLYHSKRAYNTYGYETRNRLHKSPIGIEGKWGKNRNSYKRESGGNNIITVYQAKMSVSLSLCARIVGLLCDKRRDSS